MNIDEAKASKREFCKKLKEAREFQEKDLEKVSEKSKISITYLRNIEDANWSFLPRTYIRSFLRTYAQILGMNVAEVLAEFDQIYTVISGESKKNLVTDVAETGRFSMQQSPKNKKFRGSKLGGSYLSDILASFQNIISGIPSNLFIGILGGLAVIVVIVIAVSMWKSTDQDVVEEIDFNEVVEEHQDIIEPEKISQPEKIIEEPEQAVVTSQDIILPERLKLETIGVDTCYIRIYADSDTSFIADMVLTRDESRTFEADSSFLVILGSAADMKLILNDKDLGFFGTSGKVVTLDINENGARRIRRPDWTIPGR